MAADRQQPRIGQRTRNGTTAVSHHTTALTANRTPIYGIIAGDSDLLPPRFSGDRRVDVDDWAQDFRAYVKLRKLAPGSCSGPV